MNRRQFVRATGCTLTLTLSGCAFDDDAGSIPPGRIDPLGHDLANESPFYTFGHVSRDGRWGVVGSYPRGESTTASTLFDLSELDRPAETHQLDAATASTRTNDVKFDALREGLYYRSQEADDEDGQEGIEVVDFGWDGASPDGPDVIARLETPNTGVHKITPHDSEPILYLVDHDPGTDVGVLTADVSDPAEPQLVDAVGPEGGCHDVEYDPVRNVLHAAYIVGASEGYVVYDLDDPLAPDVLGHFEYAERPDYEELGEPGFERCHQIDYDPGRELVIVGDEVRTGVPGGKHVFDVGWDDGSLEAPNPIGFTHSPDAREMGSDEAFWWTTHFHDVVQVDDEVLLVDGGYRQGAWVCNLTDPREPTPAERYATVHGADRAPDHSETTPGPATPPFAWSAVYNEERDFVFVSDSVTGAYTFELSAEPARGRNGAGPDGHYDLDAVLGDDPGDVGSEGS